MTITQKFWNWVEKTFQPHYQAEIRRYLDESVDHKDLKVRMEHLYHRGLIWQPWWKLSKKSLVNLTNTTRFVRSKTMTTTFLLKDLQKALVGFEDFFHTPVTTYPPYNLEKTETGYKIELAVAGFTKSDIKVYEENGYLAIEGRQSSNTPKNWIYHGLAGRGFKKSFALNGELKVEAVTLADGILTVTLAHQAKTQQITYEIA